MPLASCHPGLLALGYSEAAMSLRGPSAAQVTAMISISGDHEYPPDAPTISRRLVLRFDDVDAIDLSDADTRYIAWSRQRWSAEMGRPLKSPTIHDAEAIIEFARELVGGSGTLLCTCSGGVSRSTAAALICLATWSRSGREAQCVEELLRIRPCAVPLRSLVGFADGLLGREGRLVGAVDRRPSFVGRNLFRRSR